MGGACLLAALQPFSSFFHCLLLFSLPASLSLMHTVTFQNGRTFSYCGTVEYMPPEMVGSGDRGHNLVRKAHNSVNPPQVFVFACVQTQLFTGFLCFVRRQTYAQCAIIDPAWSRPHRQQTGGVLVCYCTSW